MRGLRGMRGMRGKKRTKKPRKKLAHRPTDTFKLGANK